jgi:hypothetical protein
MVTLALASVGCCTVRVRTQFVKVKCEERVNMRDKSFSVTSLVKEKYEA